MGVVQTIRRVFSRKPAADDQSLRVQQLVADLRKAQRARYDGAANSDEYANYWANADGFDADSANSREVRHTLIKRSRYEAANNGYADGIAQTYSTDLVGVGPQLRMMTNSKGFNQLVEREFYFWTQEIHFSRKLWCMAHAKHVDGEGFGVVRRNPRVKHPVNIDLVLYEAEQCQTPYLPFGEEGRIDGINFDEFGNPESYEFLKHHPGSANKTTFNLDAEQVPAEYVLHWFKMRRPGQHRGVPECASTLNLGASFRRLREASLSTAEKVAAWTLFLKTLFNPGEDELASVDELVPLEIVRGMMTTLPNNVEPYQLKAEQPGPMYDTFHRTLLNEQARPKNMPYNKAACDSSSYNYASGRLDHQTYYAALDVDREDCNDRVLEPLFRLWFDWAIRKYGWLGGNPEAIGYGARAHLWDWPKHRVADVESEANANRTRLESGQIGIHRLYSDAGMDFDDEVAEMATTFGVSEQVMRTRLLDTILPPPKQDPAAPAPSEPAPVDVTALLTRRNGSPLTNGNGAHHG